MTISLPQVKPGDLITARFMTDLVAALSELDARVTTLEGGGGGPTGPTPVRLAFEKVDPPGFDPLDDTFFVFLARSATAARLALSVGFSVSLGATIFKPPLESFASFADGAGNPLPDNSLGVAAGVETPFSLVLALPDEKDLRRIWPKALDLEAPIAIRVTGGGEGIVGAEAEVRAVIGTGVVDP